MKKLIGLLITLTILGLLFFAGLFVAAIAAIAIPIMLLLKGNAPKSPSFENEQPQSEIKGETIDVEFTRVETKEDKLP